MIDVHHVQTPNGHKVTIMLEEVGLEYRTILYNIFEGKHLIPEFRRINPNRRLPAIVDHDPVGGGAPLAIFETGAILQYLAEKTGRFLPVEPRRRYAALQWLTWQVAGLGPMHGQAHHFVRYCPEPNDYAVNRYRNEARRLLDVMNGRLAEAEYLAEEYSIADIACWPWVRAARGIDMDIDDLPHLSRWFEAIGKRPAVIAGAALPADNFQLKGGSPKSTLTPEQWSIVFGDRLFEAARAVGE
ncbi:MAG: glutathione S-transferase C-terminal domain-containing protein [Sphingomonadaceae bacterium]